MLTCVIMLIVGVLVLYPKYLLNQATEAALIETAIKLTEAVKSGKIVEYEMQEYKGFSLGDGTYNVFGRFQVVLKDNNGK